MSKRNAIALTFVSGGILASTIEGCGGQTLTVGYNEDSGATAQAGGSQSGSSSGGGGYFGDAGGTASGMPGGAGAATIAVTTCNGESSDASATLGVGFSALAPIDCTLASGPTHAVASAADVMGLLAGDWSACGGQVFGMAIASAYGVAFATDGEYRVLGATADGSLAPLDSIPGTDAGSASAPADTGTYDVVDGAATFGPGTYVLELHPAAGGLFSGEVAITDSPRQIHYFAKNASAQPYAPAAPWSPRTGVCSCVSAQATTVAQNDPVGLAAAMLGRWVWCGNEAPQEAIPPLPPNSALFDGPGMGIEFSTGNTWYELEEDSTGALTRSSSASGYGTFSFTGIPASLDRFFGQEPGMVLELYATTGAPRFTKVVVTENPRTLLLNTDLGSDGQVGSSIENAILFPNSFVTVSACDGEPPDAPATMGIGLTAFPPTECTDPMGPPLSFASAADVASALIGDWIECGSGPASGQVFGMAIDSADGIELAADGTYVVLGETADGSLVALDSISESDAGSPPTPGDTGTYDVVDGSTTYGPGTYALELHPAAGGLFSGQVIVGDTPRQLLYFSSNATPEVYAPPAPWSPRAGVCSCASVQATQVAQYDANALAAAMVGRWVWCGNQPLPGATALPPNLVFLGLFDGPGMGIEFTSDGFWYELEEDSTGALSRGAGPSDYGPFQLTNDLALNPMFQPFYSNAEPLWLELETMSGDWGTKVIVTQSPRALLLNTPRQLNGSDGLFMQNAVLFPLP
jgi:hypothetical protein